MTDARTIRALFLEPRPHYTLAEASALGDMPWQEVRDWVAVGELQGVDTPDGVRIPWPELVSFGMDFVSANAPWLDREVAGMLAALAWPETGEAI